MRTIASPTPLLSVVGGVGVAAAIVATFWLLGMSFGREPSPPWVCDDTRYVDTVPAGRGVVGPAVSASPGCGL